MVILQRFHRECLSLQCADAFDGSLRARLDGFAWLSSVEGIHAADAAPLQIRGVARRKR